MKIFQIMDNICHYDATRVHPDLRSTEGRYPSDVLFVEAPDNVFEGWGYVDGQFIHPTPPEGWLYDEATGTFYPETEIAPSATPSIQEDVIALLVDHEYRLTLMELGV